MLTRNPRRSSIVLPCLTVLMFLLGINSAAAQQFRWPEEPQNLQVLPDTLKGRELGQVMRGFTVALGVRCNHCHVGEGNDLTQYDFAADDKSAKEKARLMIEMVMAINGDYLTRLPADDGMKSSPLEVGCVTCHRKNTRPVMLEDVLVDAINSGGFDAAAEKYHTLREQYYGGFAYDFSAGALARLGEQLSREGDFETAIKLAQLDIDANGENASLYWTLGSIQQHADKISDAIKSFEKGRGLASDEWHEFFEQKLQSLTEQ